MSSWLDKVKTDFKITFADNRDYYPKWVNAKKKFDANYTEFVFRGLEGSLVDRRLSRGTRYELELYFDNTDINGLSQDNLELSDVFYQSTKYTKDGVKCPPMTISHPFYGKFIAQPLGFEFDNTEYNVTKISTTIIETISEQSIAPKQIKKETIRSLANASINILSSNYNELVKIPSTTDVLAQTNVTNSINNDFSKSALIIQSDLDKLSNLYNLTMGYIQDGQSLVNSGINTIAYIESLALLPASFAMTTANRLATLITSINNLTSLATNAVNVTLNAYKYLFENIGATLLNAMNVTSVTPAPNDYVNANDVVNVIDDLVNTYNSYIITLDSLQSANGGMIGGYIPNATNLQTVTDIFLLTVNSLFDIVANSKIQYTVYLPEDSNIILVAYKYLGLQPDDSTIDAIISLNDLTLDELITLKKGRKIIYYA